MVAAGTAVMQRANVYLDAKLAPHKASKPKQAEDEPEQPPKVYETREMKAEQPTRTPRPRTRRGRTVKTDD